MQIHQNYSLKELNTFGIGVKAEHFAELQNIQDLQEAIRNPIRPLLLLGGGSNLLFTNDVKGLVLKVSISGIRVVREFKNRVWVEAGAGVNWHQLVLWAVQHNYGGIENLSLIPGTVGAAPVQNIGAYGVELKDVFVKLKAVDLTTGKLNTFFNSDCAFGYRDSIFKKAAKGKFCITSVVLSLSKTNHRLKLSYGDIHKTLEQNKVSQPDIADISKAVIQIRSSKLPDPAKIGNCGSFFKNPESDQTKLREIQVHFPNVPFYELPKNKVKIPAGWLIEQCGWKGKRVGNTGSYEKQALVLVNHGGATGEEVSQLAQDIIASVQQKFGIRLEPEVNII
ncbi:MAG: UDP-N-acetylmuramate dehydrogenase [Saprospiraceae bacterium]